MREVGFVAWHWETGVDLDKGLALDVNGFGAQVSCLSQNMGWGGGWDVQPREEGVGEVNRHLALLKCPD